jgi:transcription elongation factor Elf1
MMFTAVCHLCGAKQRVPSEFNQVDAAKKWASAWEDRHLMEVKHDDTNQTGSETQA